MGLEGEWPQQFELAEFEELAGCELAFSENPLFEGRGLPPIEQRLPEEPMIVQPHEEIGTYGGTIRGIAKGLESGTSEIISWRFVSAVRMADDFQTIVPNVLKSYEWNDDYTELTWMLRKGHKWSDGEPFTADDILFWWEDIMLNEELTSNIPEQWVFGGAPAEFEKIDDITVKITFADPAPGLLTYLSVRPYAPWACKHFLKEFHIDYNADANDLAKAEGYDSWADLFRSYWNKWDDAMNRPELPTLNSHVLLEEPTTEHRIFVPNPYYFKVDTTGQQLPYINEIYETFIPDYQVMVLKIVAGEADAKTQTLELRSAPLLKENEAKGNYTLHLTGQGKGNVLYAFNRTSEDPVLREIFSDVRFNQAMSLAINREEISDLLFLGMAKPMQAVPHPSVSFMEPEMVTYMTEYDPDQANALLDEMGLEIGADGWRQRPDGQPLIIFFEYCQQAGPVEIHELVKDYWETVGVQIRLKELSTEAWRARVAANEQDIAVWHTDYGLEPQLIAAPYQLYPPFGPGTDQLLGVTWRDWYTTDGESGEEPPDDVKRLFELAEQFKTQLPGSDEYLAIGKEMVQIHLDNLFLIGTVGLAPKALVVSNRLGNTGAYVVGRTDYFYAYPYRGDQWFFKESD